MHHHPLRFSAIALASISASIIGCAEPPDDTATTGAEQASIDATRSPFPASCHTEKFAFTALTACQNDGSVELCVPKNNVAVQRYLRSLDRDVQFLSSSGRARCDVTTQLLVQYPTSVPRQCTEAGALRRSAAIDLCHIAALPQVTQIVPTFYE